MGILTFKALWVFKVRALPFKALPFGEWIVLEDTWLIASNNSFQQVGFSFEFLQNVSTLLHTPLLLSFIQQPWYHFAQIFLIPRSYVMILHTLSLLRSSSSAIILTVRRWLLCTFSLTHWTFSFLLVDGLPLQWSSSTSSLPSLNLLCHSKRRVRDILSSVGVFPKWTRNFRLIRCSTLILRTKEKKAKNS